MFDFDVTVREVTSTYTPQAARPTPWAMTLQDLTDRVVTYTITTVIKSSTTIKS